MTHHAVDCVVGAGVIGLSCAWRAAAAGRRVTVLDPAPGVGRLVGGRRHARPGHRGLAGRGAPAGARGRVGAALAGVRRRARRGRRATGRPAHRGHGRRRDRRRRPRRAGRAGRATWPGSAARSQRLDRPGAAPAGTRARPGGARRAAVPGDLAVDNRVLLAALRAAAERAGCGACATAGRRRCSTTATASPACAPTAATCPPSRCWSAAGAHSAALHPALRGLVRPVKGEILRLAHRAGAFPPPIRTVRALVDGRPVYAVPARRRRAGDRGDPGRDRASTPR